MATSEKKRQYNRQYYLKNKERILSQRKFSKSNGVNFIQPQSSSNQIIESIRQSRFSGLKFISLEAVLLFSIISLTTVFLLQESIHFYTSQDSNSGASALLKALTCEGVLFGLSWAKFEGRSNRLIQNLLTTCIILLFVMTTCGALFSNALKQKSNAEHYRSTVASLQVQIEEKEKLYEELLSRNRLSTSRTLGYELDRLREVYRTQLQAAPDSSEKDEGMLVLMNAALLAIFRILALCANSLFIRRFRACLEYPRSSFQRLERSGLIAA